MNKGRIQDTKMEVEEVVRINMPTEYGTFELVAFDDKLAKKTLFALTKGSWEAEEPILVRVHSSCITGDIIGSLRCDCGPQLQAAMKKVEAVGKGVIIYVEQEGRGIGFLSKMKAYKLQEEGLDTVEANLNLGFEADQREYKSVTQALQLLNVQKIRLMSNNPLKQKELEKHGLEVVENVTLEIEANEHNNFYLKTKRDKMGHILFQHGLK
ncbi:MULTISPECIES: GTP cyclohydrolase II [unclassified Aureispira]|uniref:GTP cyclohydrolase II n=1 Tax=unclassified Aureispira TaxID=2649989 RepID=UPI000697EB34|nr:MULTISPECIES: GTP cyclohydrolase II [unclassified Aureispira]WMX12747.1 GTP cyclohydrolase II [Aureispira sp. CCB-E]